MKSPAVRMGEGPGIFSYREHGWSRKVGHSLGEFSVELSKARRLLYPSRQVRSEASGKEKVSTQEGQRQGRKKQETWEAELTAVGRLLWLGSGGPRGLPLQAGFLSLTGQWKGSSFVLLCTWP